MTKKIRRKRLDSDAIVFYGQVNTRFNDGVIHFPTDSPEVDYHKHRENKVDLSPLNINQNQIAPAFEPVQGAVSGTFANCGIFSANGTFTAGTAYSGVFTFPNGTQVSYSKCQVVQLVAG